MTLPRAVLNAPTFLFTFVDLLCQAMMKPYSGQYYCSAQAEIIHKNMSATEYYNIYDKILACHYYC